MPTFEYEERARYLSGVTKVAGVDEAGRGPLAGEVVAAAIIIPEGYHPEWIQSLDDSKKLSEKKREMLYEKIFTDSEVLVSVGRGSVEEIEELNILQATHLAMKRAATALTKAPDYCLIDGRPVSNFPFLSEGIVKGDSKSYSIAAASIVAKVTRDRLMLKLAQEFPQYSFERHKGYGTKLHLEALKRHGATPHHRRTFRPVAECLSAV